MDNTTQQARNDLQEIFNKKHQDLVNILNRINKEMETNLNENINLSKWTEQLNTLRKDLSNLSTYIHLENDKNQSPIHLIKLSHKNNNQTEQINDKTDSELIINVPGTEPLTLDMLRNATLTEQKQFLGERLFVLVQQIEPTLAAKITGIRITSNNIVDLSTPIKTKRTKAVPQECRICGAFTKYSYFGTISYRACKMFFKRNADTEQATFVCNFGGQCEINVPTLNLLQSDKSLLTTNQWTLLTNLFYCYDESQLFQCSQRFTDAHNDLQSNYVISPALVDDLVVAIYNTVKSYLCSNDDIRKLSFNDRSMILCSASNNMSCISGGFILSYCYLYGLDAFLNAVNKKFGKSLINIPSSTRKYVDPDIVVATLSISLFALSENTCYYYSNISKDLTNPLNILEIQNKYAEVRWKYLLYKYGHYEAVK
ncbi:unnamed protein product [Rotaria sp. Silwood2]|nr:unnamed protein product [Rotaria sp. Silwood2]